MLSVYKGEQRKIRFLTYDLEWYPDTEVTRSEKLKPYGVRLVGVYDGKRHREYSSVAEFLDAEMTSANRGAIFFAHAGGLADVQFVLEQIIERGNPAFKVDASLSGSSAIIVRCTYGNNSWVFVDSYWLLRDSLKKIGASIGEQKGGGDYRCNNFPACGHPEEPDYSGKRPSKRPTCIFYAPLNVLTEYNRKDNRILWLAINRFQEEILSLGGSLRMTIASTAMHLFRSRFLSHDIPTSDEINLVAREAYIASRVEVIRRRCQSAHYFDINSSFPRSMTEPQPGKLIGRGFTFSPERDTLALVRAKVTVPDCYLPPLPMRRDGRVFFPVGTWEQWFMAPDLRLLLESGGRIESVERVFRFEALTDLHAYVDTIYELRRKEKDEFRRLVYKYLLNALYGKFGEGTDKDSLLIHPPKPPAAGLNPRMLRAGIYLVSHEADVPHAHVPIAANVTALSRGLLTRGMWACKEVYYCDTDSIVTTDEIPTSDALGEFKAEDPILEGVFLAPKLYRLKATDKDGPYETVKAKGFRRLSRKEFDALEAGKGVRIQRMMRLRELYRAGLVSPGELIQEKFVRLVERPKRAPDGDNSRPWNIEELSNDETWESIRRSVA